MTKKTEPKKETNEPEAEPSVQVNLTLGEANELLTLFNLSDFFWAGFTLGSTKQPPPAITDSNFLRQRIELAIGEYHKKK